MSWCWRREINYLWLIGWPPAEREGSCWPGTDTRLDRTLFKGLLHSWKQGKEKRNRNSPPSPSRISLGVGKWSIDERGFKKVEVFDFQCQIVWITGRGRNYGGGMGGVEIVEEVECFSLITWSQVPTLSGRQKHEWTLCYPEFIEIDWLLE